MLQFYVFRPQENCSNKTVSCKWGNISNQSRAICDGELQADAASGSQESQVKLILGVMNRPKSQIFPQRFCNLDRNWPLINKTERKKQCEMEEKRRRAEKDDRRAERCWNQRNIGLRKWEQIQWSDVSLWQCVSVWVFYMRNDDRGIQCCLTFTSWW